MYEEYTLILKHDLIEDDGTKIQIDEPFIMSHLFDRTVVGVPAVLDELLYHFTKEVMRRAVE